MDGVILAAGRGSRLEKFTVVAPKAMSYLPGGNFLIDHHIKNISHQGCPNLLVVVGYLREDIEEYVSARYPHCKLVVQKAALGTAADGLLAVEEHLREDFIVVHGDHFFSRNPFPSMVSCHEKGCVTFLVEHTLHSKSLGYGERCLLDEAKATVTQYPIINPQSNRPPLVERFLVDGCMILPRDIFSVIRRAHNANPKDRDMKHVFRYASQRGLLRMKGVEVPGWWANINDEKTYLEVVQRLRAKTR